MYVLEGSLLLRLGFPSQRGIVKVRFLKMAPSGCTVFCSSSVIKASIIQGWFRACSAVILLLVSISSNFRMKSSASRLVPLQSLEGKQYQPFRMARWMSSFSLPLNGGYPHNKTYAITPTDQRSHDLSYCLRMTSGAM